jgi:hypothetical protein
MIINLSPQRRDDILKVIKIGDTLNINGEDFDFSQVEEGDTLPATAIYSSFFVDTVERVAGELVLTLILPNPINYSPEQAYPATLVNIKDGEVLLPGPLGAEEKYDE